MLWKNEMNKIPFSISVFILLLLFSCRKEHNLDSVTIEHCIPRDSLEYSSLSCKDAGIDLNYFCDEVFLGQYALSDLAKWFLPYYCHKTGTIERFVNARGDTCHLNLLNKYYSFSTNGLNYPEKCKQDSMRRVAYCYETDNASVELRFEELSLNMNIGIHPVLDYHDELSGRHGDEIYFARKDEIITGDFYTMYTMIVNKGNLSYSNYYSQHFYNSVTFLSREFKNVYTSDFWSDPNSIPKPIKLYYNGESGIVCLFDDNGVLWVKI